MELNKKLLNIFKKAKTTSDEDTYTCSYINIELGNKQPLVNYSTSEVDTGIKWIDGKTIYRKVFAGTSIVNINSGISSLDTMIKFDMYIKDNTNAGGWRSIPWLYNTTTDSTWMGGVYFKTDDKTIRTQMGSALGDISKYVIIMEYTK